MADQPLHTPHPGTSPAAGSRADIGHVTSLPDVTLTPNPGHRAASIAGQRVAGDCKAAHPDFAHVDSSGSFNYKADSSQHREALQPISGREMITDAQTARIGAAD
jgi:hypothetical protein